MANTDVLSYVVAFNVHEDGETEKTQEVEEPDYFDTGFPSTQQSIIKFY